MTITPQFGNPHGVYTDRPGAYAVLTNASGQVLSVFVRGRYHLPGGGIDKNEDPLEAVKREIKEETGYTVEHLQKIGEANQFLETKDLGPINKLGIYYQGTVGDQVLETTGEEDHVVEWITPETFLNSSAHEFHRWAVGKVFASSDDAV